MLKYLRSGTQSTILKLFLFGLLMMAMAGLAMMDVQGLFRNGVSSGVLVKMKGSEITLPEFDRMVQTTLREKRIQQDIAYRMGIPRQILSNEINKRLFSLAAYDMGLKVGNSTAAQQLKQILEPIVKQGATKEEALSRILRAYNLSEQQLVSSIKDQLAVQKLSATIGGTAYIPKQLIDDTIKYNNEWRSGEYFVIDSSDIGEIVTPSDKDLKTYYKSIEDQYTLPEYRNLSVMVLNTDLIKDSAKVSQENIKQYYEDNIESFTLPAKVTISQAVVSDKDTAEKIYTLAKKEKSLKKATEKFKGNFIKPDSFDKGTILEELAEAVFSGKKGEILSPIKTALGWDIIYINEVTPEAVDNLDDMKEGIKATLIQESASDNLYKLANKIDDDIAGGKTLIEVSKERNIPLKTLEKIDSYGFNKEKYQPYSGLPMYSKILKTGFEIAKGTASAVIEADDGSFIIVSNDNIFPPENQPFEKIRSRILTRWMNNEQIKALSARSSEVIAMIKKSESFKKTAKKLKKEITSTQPIKRGSTKKETGTNPLIIKALFSLHKKDAVTTVRENGAIKIIKLLKRTIKKPKDANGDKLKALHSLLVNSMQQDLMDQYRIYLFNKYKVEVNEDIMNENYNPNMDIYGDEG